MNGNLNILDDSSDSEVELKINKEFAKRYNVWRNKEELQKYKDLKKEDEESESSSENEEECPEFDEEFFRALSLLKGKDPRIYDKNYELFSNKEIKKIKTVKEKPMFIKDYERSLVLEKGGKLSDEDEQPTLTTCNQDSLKESFKKALGDELDDDDDDLLQVRTKTMKEEEEEDADYLKWLKGEEKQVSEDIKKDMSYLRNYWNDPKLDEGEKFLRDYILNKRYLEKDESEIPTYEELTSGMLSDDEKMIEEQEKFEHKYNFRFEEPDEEFIKRYPRTIGDSLRKIDNRRKQKRDEKIERKKREREQRKEELKRLKALKRKEIEDKFLKIKEVSGQDDINLNESDMESDFDSDKHDKKMKEMFNDDYYNVEEAQKPEFPYDEELDYENWNSWSVDRHQEDDYQDIFKNCKSNNNPDSSKKNLKDELEKEMIEATQPKKKIRKKSLFAKVISQPKPIYDPDGKSFDKYLEEYYKLDYEDIVGDLPVRYKYRKVIPNDFGLSVDEILAADDRELNRWCSVKKTCQYRNDEEELYDVQAYKKKSQNILVKKKVFSSIYAPKKSDTEVDNDSEIVYDPKSTVQEVEKTSVINDMKLKKVPKKRKKQKNMNASLNADNYQSGCSSENLNFSDHQPKLKQKHVSCLDTVLTFEKNAHVDAALNDEDSFEIKLASKKKKGKFKNVLDKNMGDEFVSIFSKHEIDPKKAIHPEFLDVNRNSSESNVLKNSQCASSFSCAPVLVNSCQTTKKKKSRSSGETNSAKLNETKNQFKNIKHKELFVDKRLGLSDERLAAYGINPKTFKNKIIHAKK